MIYKLIRKKDILLNLNMPQWLMVSCAFSCLLLCARIVITGDKTYLFLVWNLFLAFIPFAITQRLSYSNFLVAGKLKKIFVLFVWLLFIPNTFYILTDLFHLDKFDSAPKWFDLLLIFSFAWNGIVLGVVSVRTTEIILENTTGRSFSLLIIFIVMWLNAFGIYIGRYLRFNSWDILAQPFSLFNEMFEVLFHPLRNKLEWGMIAVYAVFMTVLYITIKKLAENFSQPNQQIKIK
jgi:uncharacterized membrane protein